MTYGDYLLWAVVLYFGTAAILAIIGLTATWARDAAKFMTVSAFGYLWAHPIIFVVCVLAGAGVLLQDNIDGSWTLAITNKRDSSCISEKKAVQAMKDGFEARTKKLKERLANADPTAIAEYKRLQAEHTQQLNDFYKDNSACGTPSPAEMQAAAQRNVSFAPSRQSANPSTSGALATPATITYSKKNGTSWEKIEEIDLPTKMEGVWRVTFPASRVYIPHVENGQEITVASASSQVKLNPNDWDSLIAGPEGSLNLQRERIPNPSQFVVNDQQAKLGELIISTDGRSWKPAYRANRIFQAEDQVQFSANHRNGELGNASGSITLEIEIK